MSMARKPGPRPSTCRTTMPMAENSAPGIGMQTWWSADAQHGSGYDNGITLYDMSYAVIA